MRWCRKPIYQGFGLCNENQSETFLDLVRQQEAVFDRWLANTNPFQELQQLMLVEQFETSLSQHMERKYM